MGIFRKKEKPGLVEKYIIWRQRVEDLEAERPAIYAGLLQLEQAAMEGGPVDPQDLQVSRQKLADHDRKLEASLAKLASLWEALEAEAAANIASRRQAAPQVAAELRQEFETECARAGRLLAEAMTLCENLGIHPQAVILAMGLSGNLTNSWDGNRCAPLGDGYGAVKRRPLEPKEEGWGATFRARQNEHRNFMLATSHYDGVQAWVRREISKEIIAAGGAPPRINHAIGGGVIHDQKL